MAQGSQVSLCLKLKQLLDHIRFDFSKEVLMSNRGMLQAYEARVPVRAGALAPLDAGLESVKLYSETNEAFSLF